jgi:RNA polymerase sigma-70 factor (ECF subfamily)
MGTLHAMRRNAPAERTAEDERALVMRCRRGDREAMGIVLAEHAEAMERHVARLIGPGADVEDVLQQAFVGAIRAFPRFRGEAQVRTWLTRIATHVAIDALRSPARRRRATIDLDAQVATSTSPEQLSDQRRELDRVEALLGHLTPMRRVALILHVFEGRPIDEVAALMGASKVATKSRIFWARRKLLALARQDPALASRFEVDR